MPAPALPPVAYQIGVISTGLNSGLLFVFLMGIYTTVYFGTVYFYVTRKTSQTRVVTATITMLYLINTAQLAIQWWGLQKTFVDSGETRNTIFIASFYPPDWAALATQSCVVATSVLADGLLIWRCFYVWDRSLLAISLPVFFLFAEIGIYTGYIIIFSLLVKLAPSGRGTILNILLASGYFLSLSSTISSTLLIVYRLYNSFAHQGNHSKKRFLHIVDVLVQSAAAYSLALLVSAIAMVVLITSGNYPTLAMLAVLNYEGVALLDFISGMAPTIMVARIALTTDSTMVMNSRSDHILGLQCQGRSGVDSNVHGGINNTVVIGHSSRELEKQTV